MAPQKGAGLAEESEPQKILRGGVEHLVKHEFDEVLKAVLTLVQRGKDEKSDDVEVKNAWTIYAGILYHCLVCCEPTVKTKVGDAELEKDAATQLLALKCHQQEQYFVMSQRLEDSEDDKVAGVGMFIHAELLALTGDTVHARNVLEDSVSIKDPLCAARLALRVLDDKESDEPDADLALRLLQPAIDNALPFGLGVLVTRPELKEKVDAEFASDVESTLCQKYDGNPLPDAQKFLEFAVRPKDDSKESEKGEEEDEHSEYDETGTEGSEVDEDDGDDDSYYGSDGSDDD